jgi:hypothetical protein
MTTVNVTDPIHLDALGPRDAYRTRVPSSVPDVAGTEVARLSLVPPLFVTRAMAALRQAGPIPAADLDGLLAAAADAFASGTIGGLSVREYEQLVSRTSGTPCRWYTPRPMARLASYGRPGRPPGGAGRWARPALCVTLPSARDTRSGCVRATCSPSTPPATTPASTVCGWKRWRWVTASPAVEA